MNAPADRDSLVAELLTSGTARSRGEISFAELANIRQRLNRRALRQGTTVDELTKGMTVADVARKVRRGEW